MAGPYFDELTQALGAEADPAPRRVAEGASTATTQRLRGLLESVRASLVSAGPSGESLRAALDRLQQIVAAYDETGIELAAEQTYARAGALRTDVELLLAHDSAPQATARLLGMQSYVRRASVPELDPDIDQHELAIDRRLLLQRLTPSVAVDAPHQIEELEAGFGIFRRRYIELYVQRHRAFHEIVTTWRREFTQEHAARLNALRLLNAIPQLGAPVGSDLALRAERILARVPQCDFANPDVREALALEPRCPGCDLDLMAAPPSAEVAAWHDDCLTALRLQQRRLARAAIARATGNAADPAIDRFLRVVQASDLLPLIEVMDESVQALIREMLAEH